MSTRAAVDEEVGKTAYEQGSWVPDTPLRQWFWPRFVNMRPRMSMQAVAERLGMHPTTLWKAMRGDIKTYPRSKNLNYSNAVALGMLFNDVDGCLEACGHAKRDDTRAEGLASHLSGIDDTLRRREIEQAARISMMVVREQKTPGYLAHLLDEDEEYGKLGAPVYAPDLMNAIARSIEVSAGLDRPASSQAPVDPTMPGMGAFSVITVRGNCMEPFLFHGDVAIISRDVAAVRDGDAVVATVDYTEQVCKIICIPEDGSPSYLEPLNGEGRIPEDRFVVTGIVKQRLAAVGRPVKPGAV